METSEDVAARHTADRTSAGARVLRRRRKAAFMMLTAVVFAVLMSIISEMAVRVRAWVRYGSGQPEAMDQMAAIDPATGLNVLRPGYQRHSSRVSMRINSLGFRGADFTVAKPPRTIRIAALGASTTFCAEVSSDDAVWPHRLQEALQRSHPDVTIQVINAGVPGYLASDSLKNLQLRVLPLDPDLVIYYEANNDLAFDTRTLARAQHLIPESSESGWSRMLARHSLLFDLVQKNLRISIAQRTNLVGKLDRLPPNLPDRFVGQLDKFHRELENRGIPMVMSTFFVKYRRNQPADVQMHNASGVFYYMPWMTLDTLLDGIDMYNDAIVEYARSHGVVVIDDRDSIPGDDRYFADWIHFADAGAAAMGERVGRFIEDHDLLRPLLNKANHDGELAQ
jgi:lysophospholipase L1-like esterase